MYNLHEDKTMLYSVLK